MEIIAFREKPEDISLSEPLKNYLCASMFTYFLHCTSCHLIYVYSWSSNFKRRVWWTNEHITHYSCSIRITPGHSNSLIEILVFNTSDDVNKRRKIYISSSYPWWFELLKAHMKAYVKSPDVEAWEAIVNDWNPPMKDDDKRRKVSNEEAEWANKEDTLSTHNSRSLYVIFSGVDSSQFKLSSDEEVAKQAWDILQTIHAWT